MLTLDEFIAQYIGQQGIGDTPQNKGQCVGLIEVWTDNLSLPHTWGNAIDLLKDADSNSFDITYNKLGDTTQFPPDGAIVVLGKPFGLQPDGTYDGHTGISKGSDGNTLRLLEQNDPINSPIQIKEYSYNSCIGWMIPKIQQPGQSGELPANYVDIVHGSTQWDTTVKTYMPQLDPTKTDFTALQTVIAGFKSTVTDSSNQVKHDTITIAGLNKQIDNLNEKLALADQQRQQDSQTYLAQIDALKTASGTNDKMVGSFQGQIKVLQEQVKKVLDDKHTLAVQLAQCQAGTKVSFWQTIVNYIKGVTK